MAPITSDPTPTMLRSQQRRGLRYAAGLLLFSLVVLLGGPAFVAAQDEAPADSRVLTVDTRDDDGELDEGVVRIYAPNPGEFGVAVNGTPATVGSAGVVANGDIAVRTVIVIDNSQTDEDNLDELVAVAQTYVAEKAPNEQIAIVTTGATARTVMRFTSNRDSLNRQLGRIESLGALRLNDGMLMAGQMLETNLTEGQHGNVVVLTGGGDELSVTPLRQVLGILGSTGSTVHILGVPVRNFDAAAMQRLVSDVGGSLVTPRSDADILAAASGLADRSHSVWDVPFTSSTLADGNSMTISVGDRDHRVAFVANSLAERGALRPPTLAEPSPYAVLTGQTAIYLGVLLAGLSVALGIWAISLLLQKSQSGIDTMLSAYDGDSLSDDDDGGLANNVIFQRAVELTEAVAEKQGFLATTEQRLEQADLPFKAAEALTFYAGIVVASGLVGLLMTRNVLFAAGFTVFGVIVPHFVLKFMAARRKKAFMTQLPDTLQLLAGTLKAGYSFVQGVESVSKESDDPMGGELRKIVTEAQLGRPLEDAMEASAERMDSDDWAWAVMAVKIQREVGGNLAELLMTVSDTMVARERLRRDVLALTAEGRISAIVLGALPILLAGAMYVINPAYIAQLWNDTLGNIFLGLGIFAALVGFTWMKKIIEIEI